MNRRDFVRYSLALGSTTILPSCRLLIATEPPSTPADCQRMPLDFELFAIDVHCHIINASDVPGEDFLKVVAHDEGGLISTPLILELIKICVRLASPHAISAKVEADALNPDGEHDWSSFSFNPDHALSNDEKTQVLLDQVVDELQKNENQAVGEFVFGGQGTKQPMGERSSYPNDIDLAAQVQAKLQKLFLWAFVQAMLRTRQENFAYLKATYPNVGLFIPTLLDFDHWLGKETPRSDLSNQINLMSLMMQHNNGAMHGFVPFNPWNSIIDKDYFSLITDAILVGGFIGIKLYPPMGFAPYGNGQMTENYPKSWNKAGKKIKDFPDKLDQQMLRLFQWCSKHNVPIMAHANPSKGPDNVSVLMGGPEHWEKAYEAMCQHGIEPPSISFGHFGGSYSADENRQQWAGQFAKILIREPSAYADLSYWEAFLKSKPEGNRTATIDKLHQLLNNPQLTQKLMYGSDWSMITQEKDHECYYDDFLAAMIDLSAKLTHAPTDSKQFLSQIMGENAVNFLGLRMQDNVENNGSRLAAFYKAKNISRPMWFTRLNGAL